MVFYTEQNIKRERGYLSHKVMAQFKIVRKKDVKQNVLDELDAQIAIWVPRIQPSGSWCKCSQTTSPTTFLQRLDDCLMLEGQLMRHICSCITQWKCI